MVFQFFSKMLPQQWFGGLLPIALCVCLVSSAVSQQSKLKFPIVSHGPYDTQIFSVIDHQRGIVKDSNLRSVPDGIVVTYTGERGRAADSSTTDSGGRKAYGNPDGVAYRVNGVYQSGTDKNYLWYESGSTTYQHPGYDFGVSGIIRAPADGMLYIVGYDPINHYANNASDWCNWHVFKVVEQNGSVDKFLHSARLLRFGESGATQDLEGLATTALDKANPHLSKGAAYNCVGSVQFTNDVPVTFVHAGDSLAQIGHWSPPGVPLGIHLHYEHLNSSGQLLDPYGWEGSGPDPLQGNTGEYMWEGCGRPIVNSIVYDLNQKLLMASGSGFLQQCGNQPANTRVEVWKAFNLTDKAASGVFLKALQTLSITDTRIIGPLDPDLIQSDSVRVVKIALNGGPASRAVRPTSGTVPDVIPPTVGQLFISSSSITRGSNVTIQSIISDGGGSGLDRAELWRAPDNNGRPGNWAQLQTNKYSGNGPLTASFNDTPNTVGVYWYGTHVIDRAGNQKNEPAPVSLIVNAPDTTPPTVGNLTVNPGSVRLGTGSTIQFTISDSGGSGLDRAELWRAPDNNGRPGNWAQLQTSRYSGNGPLTASFNDTPNAPGRYWYGTHVFDKAGNQKNEPVPISLTVTAPDRTPPTVGNLTVNPGSVRLGTGSTIQFTISDSGGSGLDRAELWRALDNNGRPGNWVQLQTNGYSGNGPLTASFNDSPSTAGRYWYGTHVFDKAGNQNNEPVPVSLTVTAPDTTSPTVGNLTVSPGSIRLGTVATIQFTISDNGGSGLNRAELWRASDNNGRPGNWTQLLTNNYSGNGPLTVIFRDVPQATGSYWYGTHVFDNAGNQRNEPSPVKVNVTK